MSEDLTNRETTVLTAIVEVFLESGEPVSSAMVLETTKIDVSSATIRNTMKKLEDRGFLQKPHHSAGRVPSPAGIRLFVDAVKSEESIDSSFNLESETMRGAVAEAAELLSNRTQLAGLAVGPSFERSKVREITLVPLSERRILVVVVSEASEAFERVIHLDVAIDRDRLGQIQTLLNASCDGKTISELRRDMRRALREARDAYRKLAETAVTIADQLAEHDHPEVMVEHTSNLLGFDELTGDVERFRTLMIALEEREQLVEILDALHFSTHSTVYIGPELGGAFGDDLSLVVCNYFNDDEPAGLIGVLGPVRMDYARLIPLVDQAARMISKNKEDPS